MPGTIFQCHMIVISCIPQNNPMNKLPLLSPFLWMRKLRHRQVMQLVQKLMVSRRVGIKPR